MRKNAHKIPEEITKGFIINGYFDYPPIFPWILSFFSKKMLEEIQGFIAPFFDSLNCIVVFSIAYLITSRIEIALLSQLVYMLTPLIALENSYLTPRSFGYLNYTLAVFPLLFYSETHNQVSLYISFVFGTLIFLTHRFAMQSYLFSILFLTVYDKSIFYLSLYITCGITAVVFTKGYYLRVLNGHLHNIYFWILNYKFRFAHQIRGNQNITLTHKDFISFVYYVLEKFSPIGLLVSCFSISGPIVIVLSTYGLHIPLQTPSLIIKISYLSVFFYILSVAVLSIKKLIPIGEGQRYLEMTASMSSVIFSFFVFTLYKQSPYTVTAILIAIFISNLGIIVFTQNKAVLKDKNRSLTEDLYKIYNKINSIKGIPRILCIPHQITTMTLYHTKADVLVNADNPGLMEITDIYPIFKTNLVKLIKKHNLTHLILRQSFANTHEMKVEKYKIVTRSGDILLIDLQKHN